MMVRMHGWVVGAFAVLAASSTAHAGGTTTDTGTTGTDSGSETTSVDSTDTSSTGDSGGFDEGSCGNCSPGSDGAVVFAAPADGATVESPFTVDVTATADCSCDDCGCYDDIPQRIVITVDGSPYGSPCESSTCSLELELATGFHVIEAIAYFDFHENTASLQVEVVGGDESDTVTSGVDDSPDETGTPGESSSAAGSDDDDDSGGCSCRADAGGGTGAVNMAFVLFGLVAGGLQRRL